MTDLVDPPRARRHAFRTLNPEEAKRLIEGVRDDRLGALVAVAMMTGMREGELLALRWRDVDLKRGTVQVRGSRQHDGTIRETKTAGSRRLVLLPRVACEALGRHRASQASERLRLGPEWEDNDLVFANKVGRTLSAQNLLQRYFYPTLERLELPRIRFHDLRHTAATLLLAEGVHPKIVSEMLGHTEVGITLDLYSHVTPTMQAEAVRALDAVFGSQNGSQDHDPERKIPGQPS
ncbi:MAG: site-specific integrase [Actinomycetes bacterium]